MDTNKSYTINDLADWGFDGKSLAVIGHPIKHSLSPIMHNALINSLSNRNDEYKDWAYFKFDIQPDHLQQALKLFYEKNFLGLNLTVPHKVMALDFTKVISNEAINVGAINTLKWTQSGYEGFNTDGYGLSRAIINDFDLNLENNNILIIGAGGAARAAVVESLNNSCDSIFIKNRSSERLDALLNDIIHLDPNKKISRFESETILPSNGVVINATSIGLNQDDPIPIDFNLIPQSWAIYDMVYSPSETNLVKQAKQLGYQASMGLSMLSFQGAKSFEIWAEETFDHALMLNYLDEHIKNI